MIKSCFSDMIHISESYDDKTTTIFTTGNAFQLLSLSRITLKDGI